MRERNGSKGKAARQETAQEEEEKKKYHCEEVDLAFCSRRNFKSRF